MWTSPGICLFQENKLWFYASGTVKLISFCPLCFSNQSQISFSLTSFASDSPVVLKDELLFSFSSICGGVKLGILLSSRRNGLDAIWLCETFSEKVSIAGLISHNVSWALYEKFLQILEVSTYSLHNLK